MIPRYVEIGPFTLYIYGIVISIASLLGWILIRNRAHFYKIDKKIFESYSIILPLIFALVGARIYHVIDYWDFYSRNSGEILSISSGGLGIFGGILGFFTGLLLFSKIKKIKTLSLFDLASPSFLLGQSIGRLGNFINQEGFGPPTEKPWGVYISTENRPDKFIESSHFHPTFFYEAILGVILFSVLILLSKKLRIPGQIFSLYLIFYGFERYIVEFWRIDTWTISQFKVAHILSILLIIVGLTLFIKTKNQFKTK